VSLSVKEAAQAAVMAGEQTPPMTQAGDQTVFLAVMRILRDILAEEERPAATRRSFSQVLGRTALDDVQIVQSQFGDRVGDVLGAYEARTLGNPTRDIRER
jgi:hypothetical protein